MNRKRVVSGIQPTGKIHIGNYFGSIKPFIELQDSDKYDCYYFIADYHALTTIKNKEILFNNIKELLIDLLSIGINPEKTVFYRQSDIKKVCELMWLLSTITSKGLLDRNHANKTGVDKMVGTFLYPELMAADILGINADIVPVGKDQIQHIEITRQIALSFNHNFDELLTVPELLVNRNFLVLGIDGNKMSKSYNNTIPLFCSEKELNKKVSLIKTSSVSLGMPINPDDELIYELFCLFASDKEAEEMRYDFLNGRLGYYESKQLLKDKIINYFSEFNNKRKEISLDYSYIKELLLLSKDKVNKEFDVTLSKLYNVFGL